MPSSTSPGHLLEPTDDLTAGGAPAADRLDAARGRRGRAGAARGRDPRRAARADRERDVALPAAALGLDPGAVGGPAPLRLVHAGGHSPGGRRDGRHPRLPGVGRQLLRPVRDRAGRHATGSSSAPTSPAGCAAATSCWSRSARRRAPTPTRPPTTAPAPPTASSSSRASSASAPATWRRWRRSTSATTARSTAADAVARDRGASRRRRAAGREGAQPAARGRRPRAGARPAPEGDRRCLRRGSCFATSTSPSSPRSRATASHGGYRALERACRELEPGDLIGTFEESGLRGRGGAGFSMGKKGSFLPRGEMAKYVCCNADESEPGAFKDRELMQKNPHQLIEGVRDRGACGRRHLRLHLHPRRVLGDRRRARPRRRRGLRGQLPGPEHARHRRAAVELVVHRGAGAYICGEETALLDALEGKRGNPRLKPPFPAIQGLYGGPTLINNVETLSNLPHIVNNGSNWFKELRHRAVAGDQGGLGLRLRAAARQLRGRARDPLARDHLRARRRARRGPAGEGLVPGRLLVAGADRGRARPPLHLRGHGRGRLDARLRARSSSPTTPSRSPSWRCARRASTTTSPAASARRAARGPTGR